MGTEFQAMAGAEGWQLSNPPILALAPLRASMEIFSEAGLEPLRAKSISLTGYMEFLLGQEKFKNVSVVTPREPQRRGAQLSVRLSEKGREICDRLTAHGVIGDWREPDTYRVAAVPLYNTYSEVFHFVEKFSAAVR